MERHYGNFIAGKEFDSLFTDDKKTDLKPDAFSILKELIKQSLTEDATKTNPAYRTTFITRFVDSAPFTFLMSNRTCKFRTLDQFNMLLDQTCYNTNHHALIELGINDLFFAENFTPANLEDISFDDVFSPPQGPSQGSKSFTPTPVPQAAMVHFNIASLPADVQARVKKHRSDEMMLSLIHI